MNELSIEDFNLVMDLEPIYDEILEIYKKMALTEIVSNEIPNRTYLKLIDNLKEMKVKEEKIFNKLELTPKKAAFIYDAFDCNYDEPTFIAMDNDEEEVMIARLASRVYSKSIMWNIFLNDFYEYGDIDQDTVKELHKNQYYQSLRFDIMNSFLYFNNETIQKINNKTVKNYLIVVKYMLAYINCQLEDSLLENNFKIDDLYCLSNCVAEKFDLSPDDVKDVKDSVLYTINDILSRQFSLYIGILDGNGKKAYQLLNKSYLNAALVAINEQQEVDKLKKGIHNKIIDLKSELTGNRGKDFKSLKHLYNDLSDFPLIRSKCKYITLNVTNKRS